MTIPPVMRDFAKLLEFADGEAHPTKLAPTVTEEGPYSLAAAAHFPQGCGGRLIYGTRLVSDAEASPHLSFKQAKAEHYIACAEHDELAPPDMVEQLKAYFARSGANGEIEIYPSVHHGFAFPERWCYDRAAAERHWERLHALYRSTLA